MEKENALKILRELHDKALFSERTALETFIPELKESEDERIREYLIRYIDNTMKSSELKSKLLAWLEKQNSNIDNANKEYWRGYREGKQEILDKYAELEKQGEKKPVIEMITPEESLGIDSETYNKIVDECIYGDDKQKTAWDEEDEIVDEIIDFLDEYIGSVKPPSLSHPVKSKWCNWLKTLKQRIKKETV